MDAKTLRALKESIEKWERNAVAQTPDDFTTGRWGCPLCVLFWDDHCKGCPVMAATSQKCCFGTPYHAAEKASEEWIRDPCRNALRNAAHADAYEEVAFLRSLLPEEEASQ